MLKKIVFFLLFMSITASASAFTEKYYQKLWCGVNQGKTEVVMKDSTRCDCVTKTHSIEFDFGKKWAESIGQSLIYGMHTNLRPGIVLIIEKESDRKYWIRLNSIIRHFNLPIDTWLMEKKNLGKDFGVK